MSGKDNIDDEEVKRLFHEFDEAHEKFLGSREASAIFVHKTMEDRLNNAIQAVFPKPGELIKLNFFRKAHLLYGAGCIHKGVLDILLDFNSLRNKIAHKDNYKVKRSDINKFRYYDDELSIDACVRKIMYSSMGHIESSTRRLIETNDDTQVISPIF